MSSRSISPATHTLTFPWWITIVRSRQWYWFAVLHAVIVWHPSVDQSLWRLRMHYALDTLILAIGTLLFLAPSVLYPTSTVGRAWRIMALSWATLMIRQFLLGFVFDPRLPRPAWIEIALLIIYIPGILMIATMFYRLPFQRRSRMSLIIDCIAIGFATTITFSSLFGIPASDLVFITGNCVVLFASYVIWQQAKTDWQSTMRAVSRGLLALIISDTIWLWFNHHGYPTVMSGPTYTLAWLVFARTALVVPKRLVYDEQRFLRVAPIQDGIGTILLLCCAIALLLQGDSTMRPYVLAFLGIAIIIRYIEAREYDGVHTRLDTALQNQEDIRVFTAGIAHDLKSPIAALSLSLRMIHKAHPNLITTDILQTLADLSRRVLTFLDVTRSMTKALVPIHINGQELHTDITDLWQRIKIIYPQPIAFSVTISPTVIIWADRATLIRMIENILINAVKSLVQSAQHDEHWITCMIEPSSDPSMTQISITDSGAGFSPTFLEKAVIEHTLGGDSTGLGLKAVHSTLRAMHGTLLMQNVNPHGAQVILRLPAKKLNTKA